MALTRRAGRRTILFIPEAKEARAIPLGAGDSEGDLGQAGRSRQSHPPAPSPAVAPDPIPGLATDQAGPVNLLSACGFAQSRRLRMASSTSARASLASRFFALGHLALSLTA